MSVSGRLNVLQRGLLEGVRHGMEQLVAEGKTPEEIMSCMWTLLGGRPHAMEAMAKAWLAEEVGRRSTGV